MIDPVASLTDRPGDFESDNECFEARYWHYSSGAALCQSQVNLFLPSSISALQISPPVITRSADYCREHVGLCWRGLGFVAVVCLSVKDGAGAAATPNFVLTSSQSHKLPWLNVHHKHQPGKGNEMRNLKPDAG